jgi:hypothetical protein
MSCIDHPRWCLTLLTLAVCGDALVLPHIGPFLALMAKLRDALRRRSSLDASTNGSCNLGLKLQTLDAEEALTLIATAPFHGGVADQA